jgi:adenylate cyclase
MWWAAAPGGHRRAHLDLGLRTLGLLASEIERKFMVPELPGWLKDRRSERIQQGYVAIDPDGTEVRVRRIGSETLLTVKRGSGEERFEEEMGLGEEHFAALWPLTEGRRVSKTRYYVEQDDLTFEVDVFDDGLEGLITAEVEFESTERAHAFDPPDWVDEEVTDDERYSNQSLATDGVP